MHERVAFSSSRLSNREVNWVLQSHKNVLPTGISSKASIRNEKSMDSLGPADTCCQE